MSLPFSDAKLLATILPLGGFSCQKWDCGEKTWGKIKDNSMENIAGSMAATSWMEHSQPPNFLHTVESRGD